MMKKNNTKIVVIIITAIVAFAIIIGGIVFALTQLDKKGINDAAKRAAELTEQAEKEEQNRINENN